MGKKRFIHEPVEVSWDVPPTASKDPTAPDRFTWRGETFHVREVLSEWRSYARRGRMAGNMRPEHAERASRMGSWGVGEYYFRVRTEGGRVFEVYYTRAPRGSDHPEGSWFVYTELLGEP